MITIIIYTIHLLCFSWISWVLFKQFRSEPLSKLYYPTLVLKVVAGIALGMLYKFHYGYGDTLGFDKDTIEIVSHIKSYPSDFFRILFLSQCKYNFHIHEFYPRFSATYLLLKICAVFYLITNNSYWLTGMYLSLFSFIGMFSLANVMVKLFPKTHWEAAIAFLSFPAVIFWSTGLMKESIVEGCMGFVVAMILGRFRGLVYLKWLHYALMLVLLYWLFKIKFYYFIVLIPVLLMGIAWAKTPTWKWYVKLGLMCLFLFLGSLIVSKLHIHLDPQKVSGVIVVNHNDNYGFCFDSFSGGSMDAKGIIMYDHLHNSAGNLLVNLPNAWFSSMFRPLPFDASNALQLIFAMLNLGMLVLALLCVQKALIEKKIWRIEAVMCVAYFSVLGVCMAFASPNMGTLARYKVGYLPFLIYLLLVYSRALQLIPVHHLIKQKYLSKLDLC
ncbi:MAG: hypothetical protein RL711_589 [Bacteroidota bacterium]